jgi:hypothetical protein
MELIWNRIRRGAIALQPWEIEEHDVESVTYIPADFTMIGISTITKSRSFTRYSVPSGISGVYYQKTYTEHYPEYVSDANKSSSYACLDAVVNGQRRISKILEIDKDLFKVGQRMRIINLFGCTVMVNGRVLTDRAIKIASIGMALLMLSAFH